MNTEKITFNVMVMDLNILEQAVTMYNASPHAHVHFEIISEIEDELNLATIQASENNIDEVFRLGYRLADLENDLRDKGEFDF
ncbi:hypothetical protein [Neisseria bacilliformis]|uniref:hypothetical protein n=1 Tax=Neisseria bacilliformis TaxID=267212 RepID=UPI000666EAA7|nr:hypothetical protein [Neisseria bacilliformis]